ncbi:hypothetical protein ACROYT_G002908 [Oculina patagonica]
MLHASTVALCLVCFLNNFGLLKCRSTADYSEYEVGLIGDCLRSCASLAAELEGTKSKTSSRQTCVEKCLEKIKEDKMVVRDKRSTTSGKQLLTPLSRRRKRSYRVTGDNSSPLCPSGSGENKYASIRSAERKRYENSDTWYLNISWIPKDERITNFTGYAFLYEYPGIEPLLYKYIVLQKNETNVVLNESALTNWTYEDDFNFKVIALPCQNDRFESFEDLYLYLSSIEGTVPATATATLPTTDATKPDGNITTTVRFALTTVRSTNTTAVTAAIASIVTIGTLGLIFGIAYILFRNNRLSSSEMVERPSLSPGFSYDAFIIFNREDQAWVESELLQILEKKHGFKCCVHYRDFEVGASFVHNMSISVQISRKVIAVVSKNFFTSTWCNYELEQAMHKQAQENDNSVIVIKKDNVTSEKLPLALRGRSFIDYSNKVERKTWVSKLIKALESDRN